MKYTGSFFAEDEVKVWGTGIVPEEISICFDGSGGLFIHMSKQLAEELRFELNAVLDGMEHDRA